MARPHRCNMQRCHNSTPISLSHSRLTDGHCCRQVAPVAGHAVCVHGPDLEGVLAVAVREGRQRHSKGQLVDAVHRELAQLGAAVGGGVERAGRKQRQGIGGHPPVAGCCVDGCLIPHRAGGG